MAFVLLASGVGNNPYAVSSVRGTNGARRYAMPFRVIPDLGQVSENGSQPSTKQRCHVLQHGPEGSYHANGSNDFPVESRTGSGKSGADTCEAEILAWETGRDNIRLTFSEFHGGHVVVARNAGEVLLKDCAGVRLHFAKTYGLVAAGPMKAEAEAAYAAEEIQNLELRHLSSSFNSGAIA